MKICRQSGFILFDFLVLLLIYLLLLRSTFFLDRLYFLRIGIEDRIFASGQGDQRSLQDWVIPKTQKMVLYPSRFKPKHYKVHIDSK